jgi:hypothetical protein
LNFKISNVSGNFYQGISTDKELPMQDYEMDALEARLYEVIID